jgi:hypothetical protein
VIEYNPESGCIVYENGSEEVIRDMSGRESKASLAVIVGNDGDKIG